MIGITGPKRAELFLNLFQNLFTMKLLYIFIVSLLALPASFADAAMISEFRPDPPGRDGQTQMFEISGVAGDFYQGFIISIGGSPGRFGHIDTAQEISGTFDGTGFTDGMGIFSVSIFDMENPSETYVLADDFTGTAGSNGTDIDLDDDGVADNTASIIGFQDAIGVANERTTGDVDADGVALYGQQLGGQDFQFTNDTPQLIFRDASVGDFYAVNNPAGNQVFDVNGEPIAASNFNRDPLDPSFGSINPSRITAVPEPTSLIVLAGLTLTLIVRRRRKRLVSAVS